MNRRANPHVPPPSPGDPAKVLFRTPQGTGGVRICQGNQIADVVAGLLADGCKLVPSRPDAPNPGRL